MHNLGSPLTIAPGQGFSGIGSIPDHVNCQGTISAAPGGWINLDGGVSLSGSGNASLGSGTVGVDDPQSGITAGSLLAYAEYVGSLGAGTLTQSGGTNGLGNSSGGLYLGYNAGSVGTYILSGPAVLSVAGSESVACSGSGTFNQMGGSNSVGYLGVGNLGRYQFGGGTLQVAGGGLANLGVFDASGGTGVLTVAGSAIVDFSTGTLQNTASISLTIGPNSLLLVPAGFNPATAFGSYQNQGLTHNVGTPLTIAAGQRFAGNGSLADFVNCQGTILAGNGSISLNGGVMVSGTGNVNLGGGAFQVDASLSGINGGLLSASYGYVGYSGSGTFTQLGGSNYPYNMYLGYNAGSSGSYSLSGSGLLDAGCEFVGYSGSGTFNHSAGTNTYSDIYLGYNAGSSGTYSLSGSGVLAVGNYQNEEYVGYQGTGIFTQTGGTNTIPGGSLSLGCSYGASGSYNLSGSGLLSAFTEYVGSSGMGTFNHSNGTNDLNAIFLGNNPGSSGNYILGGSGLLTAYSEYVGYYGNGTFTHSGGTNNVNSAYDQLTLGLYAGSSGNYILGGSGLLTAYREYVGYYGNGTFTQSGGTNNVSNASFYGLCLGSGSASGGSYNLSGSGLLSAYTEYVGFSGTGAFAQSGGVNNVLESLDLGQLYLGYNPGSIGSYNLSGSGLLSAYAEYLGFMGTGTFTQSGGTNTISTGGLYVGRSSFTSSSSYNLSSSGMLSANNEYVGDYGPGTFNQSGGTNKLSSLYLGYNSGSSGTYNLNGGLLVLYALSQGSARRPSTSAAGRFRLRLGFPPVCP